jgi:hypothetical protein
MDWFTIIICLAIGFFLGRAYNIYKKFMKFLDKEKNDKNKTTV